MLKAAIFTVALAALCANQAYAIDPLDSPPGYKVTTHAWYTEQLVPAGANMRFFHDIDVRIELDGRACPVVSPYESVCQTVVAADTFTITVQSPGIVWTRILATANAGRLFERLWIENPALDKKLYFPFIPNEVTP